MSGLPRTPSLFGLAPCGVCPACRITAAAVRSYRTFSPLPRRRCKHSIVILSKRTLRREGSGRAARFLRGNNRAIDSLPYTASIHNGSGAVSSLWHFPSDGLEAALPDVIRHTALWSSDFPPPVLDEPRATVRSSCQRIHYKIAAGLSPDPSHMPHNTHRKIIVEIAISADGYIARPDGDVKWLDRLKGDYGMGEFMNSVDTILWGRKTYDKGLEMGMKSDMFGAQTKNYLFSRSHPGKLLGSFELVKEPIKTFAQRLRAEPGKNIWMMGGGEIIASFLDEGEIDEFSLNVIPTFIGEGIPLIHPRHRSVELQLLSTKQFPDGVVHLHYSVSRS